MNFKSKPRNYKILIGAILVISIIAIIGLKTNLPKKLLNHLNKELIEENKKIKSEKEQLLQEIKDDSVLSAKSLNNAKLQTEALKFKYNNSLKKIAEYEEAFNNYNVGDFDPNFNEFTGNVTGKDTLQVKRFNVNDQN